MTRFCRRSTSRSLDWARPLPFDGAIIRPRSQEQTMAIRGIVQGRMICLAIVVGTHSLTVRPCMVQTSQRAVKTETSKPHIIASAAQLSGTIAPDTVKALASHWDGTKLAAPLQLSECADCSDAATRKALAAASVLG